jgi:hypothetical protein
MGATAAKLSHRLVVSAFGALAPCAAHGRTMQQPAIYGLIGPTD